MRQRSSAQRRTGRTSAAHLFPHSPDLTREALLAEVLFERHQGRLGALTLPRATHEHTRPSRPKREPAEDDERLAGLLSRLFPAVAEAVDDAPGGQERGERVPERMRVDKGRRGGGGRRGVRDGRRRRRAGEAGAGDQEREEGRQRGQRRGGQVLIRCAQTCLECGDERVGVRDLC